MMATPRPEFGGCLVLPQVRGGAVVACFHYICGLGIRGRGSGDVGFISGAGVGPDGGDEHDGHVCEEDCSAG